MLFIGIAYPTDVCSSSVRNDKIIQTKTIAVKATYSQIELHSKTFNNNTFNYTSSYISPISLFVISQY